MFGYPDLDAGLNTSRFLKVIAFPKPMRHSTLNTRDSGLETMAITIVIVLTTIPELKKFASAITKIGNRGIGESGNRGIWKQ